MGTILVLGAGRSSASLIQYLLDNAPEYKWNVVVGDLSESAARERIGGSPFARFVSFDINNAEESSKTIRDADVVISLLPAILHPQVGKLCLTMGKHLLNASYISDEMKTFHDEAQRRGLLFLNECGLDPGIDHMSAMQIIDRIKKEGGSIRSFESFTGGLIAPETDPQNPWRYKFTWNPRNVVTAGQTTAKYLQNGQLKYIPYQQLFQRLTPVEVSGYGRYEGYANRDSLRYISTYGLNNIKTMLRGTLRNEGFCSAWNVFVQLGCCDDTYQMDDVSKMTHSSFIECFLQDHAAVRSVREKLAIALHLNPNGGEMKKLAWSGLLDDEPVGLQGGTPAQILEHILSKKWKLQEQDRDLVVMWHRFYYQLNGTLRQIQASLVAKGENATFTAMAKTVGLPLAIAAKLLITGQLTLRGVQVPIAPEIYAPVLSELKSKGIELIQRDVE
jgi:saccharopine dehydrogenase-like NADP-dependent oxidoreductase